MTAAQVADVKSNTAAIDVTAQVQAALDGCISVYANPGKYKITAQLIGRGVNMKLTGAGELATQFDKRFSGDLMLMQNGGSEWASFGIIGNGATYAGAGIKVSGNSNTIKKIRIRDTRDSDILTVAKTAVYLTVEDAFLLPTDTSHTFGIRQTGGGTTPRPRRLRARSRAFLVGVRSWIFRV